jgi:hypothetical protein
MQEKQAAASRHIHSGMHAFGVSFEERESRVSGVVFQSQSQSQCQSWPLFKIKIGICKNMDILLFFYILE